MDRPKKEPILLNQQHSYKLCLNCGFPNRPSDSHCMYCNSRIVEDTGLFSWFRQTYYILRWRWQLKQKRESLHHGPQMSLYRALGFFLLGAVLSGAGLYVFTLSITESSFVNAVIAVLLLLYGAFTLKSLFIKK